MIQLGDKIKDNRSSIAFEVTNTQPLFGKDITTVIGIHTYSRIHAQHSFTAADGIEDNECIHAFREARKLIEPVRFY